MAISISHSYSCTTPLLLHPPNSNSNSNSAHPNHRSSNSNSNSSSSPRMAISRAEEEEHTPLREISIDVLDDDDNGRFDTSCSITAPAKEEEEGEQNAVFGFLEIDRHRPPGTAAPSPIDPFRNHSPDISGPYEWVKTLLCIPLALLRFLVFVVVVCVGFLTSKIAVLGWKDRQRPMPRWRRHIMWITRFAGRALLFCFGYHWIRRIGKSAPRQIAPIVVCNHVSYTDPIFFFYDLFPSIVTAESHDKLPIVGTIIRAMQVIYVDRFSRASRKQAVTEIKRKASCDEFPPVMLFPEGTTTNGRSLISFQSGAFVHAFPVQPVVIRYPFVHFDPSWGRIPLPWLMFRMLTQFHNFMEVEYLPVIFPSERETRFPRIFAKKVGYSMAQAINVVQTEHSYGDLVLSSRATKLGLVSPSSYMVEMAKMERLFQLNTKDAVIFLEKFASMQPDSSGRVYRDAFLSELGLPRTSISDQVFSFFDQERKDSISFSEFLHGSMCVLKLPKFHLSCELAFKMFDTNGSHFLSKQKVKRTIECMMPQISDDNVNTILKHFNSEKDDMIGLEDFKNGLANNPEYILLFCTLLR